MNQAQAKPSLATSPVRLALLSVYDKTGLIELATGQFDKLFSCLATHEPEHRDVLPRVIDGMNTTLRVMSASNASAIRSNMLR